MLGAASIFAAASAAARTADDGMLALLARGLRPFILRRTKDQVAAELPARTEQTLVLRSRAAAAHAVRRAARPLSRGAARQGGARRPRPGEAADPRGAAAPAPGGVSSRPHRSRAGRRPVGQARRPRAAAAGARRGRPQGARLLAVHDAARPAADAARRGEPDLRVPRRQDARPRGPRRAVSGRPAVRCSSSA